MESLLLIQEPLMSHYSKALYLYSYCERYYKMKNWIDLTVNPLFHLASFQVCWKTWNGQKARKRRKQKNKNTPQTDWTALNDWELVLCKVLLVSHKIAWRNMSILLLLFLYHTLSVTTKIRAYQKIHNISQDLVLSFLKLLLFNTDPLYKNTLRVLIGIT